MYQNFTTLSKYQRFKVTVQRHNAKKLQKHFYKLDQTLKKDEHEALVFNVTATRRGKSRSHFSLHGFRKDDTVLFGTDCELNYTSAAAALVLSEVRYWLFF